MCRGGLQGSPKLLTAARSLVSCRNCRRSQRAALPRDLTLGWIPRRRWQEPHRRTPSRSAGSERPQPGSPPGLQFPLQFNAVRHSPAKTGHGCWSSLNRSGLSRPELLMQLGLWRSPRLVPPGRKSAESRRAISAINPGDERSLTVTSGHSHRRSGHATGLDSTDSKLTVRQRVGSDWMNSRLACAWSSRLKTCRSATVLANGFANETPRDGGDEARRRRHSARPLPGQRDGVERRRRGRRAS